MTKNKPFSKEIILLENVEEVADNIIKQIQTDVNKNLKRFGGVVGISGGIDSSVCMALAAKALGPDNVLGVMLPEHDSSPDSEMLAQELADKFGVKAIKEDITGALKGFGCYERRDEAAKRVFPEYDPETWKMKIGVRQSGLYNNLPPIFSLTIIDKDGNEKDKILHTKEYLQIVAASNFKQRSRMSMLYYHAEALHYAVIGTPNKHEQEQGFFVKYGDGGADVMPIGNLYKTQVYQLAEYLGIPEKIIERTPTTDTYSAEQSQEEFFYQLPFNLMDIYWYGFENGYDPAEVAEVMDETEDRVKALFRNFERKQRTTEYLRMSPVRSYYQS
ncbi:NAD(+) synthase [Rhodohalobacter sp.]|uniref:NAD(+) synthase n=1 Tax=Rhodohalobacter sp. TaxID=1974210 RepID=UPI002ACDFF33|nr:NAD(+) synthase [Rhodohalobacter sp.]MDZ7755158.1 NAD(+) synthase [Rhodohalobacter sp.]